MQQLEVLDVKELPIEINFEKLLVLFGKIIQMYSEHGILNLTKFQAPSIDIQMITISSKICV